MKSFYTNLKWILLFISSFSQAQILNGDFEQWSGGEPVYWHSSNDPMCSPGTVNIFQTSKAYSGNSAVYGKVISVNVIQDCGGGIGESSPSIATYGWDSDLTGFPISGRPKKMRVHYIYKPIGEGGAFTSTVYLTRWDFAQGERVVVGTGGFFIFNTAFLDSEYTEHISSMSYYYDQDPDTIVISFGLFSNDVGSEFYLDDISISFMQIDSPSDDDVIIAGEKDTIRWEAGSEKINIIYSLDDGNSYTTIESNYPSDSSKYIWDVPDDLLSAKAKIKIEDSQDNTQYDEISVYIKPWQLTRIDANGDFELFEPDEDGWKFGNDSTTMWAINWYNQFDYQNGTDPNTDSLYPTNNTFSSASSSDYPDWPLYVDVFGTGQCYNLGTAYPYVQKALTKWAGFKGSWPGSCYGFAVSSLLYFYNKSNFLIKFPEIDNSDNLYSIPLNESTRKAVNHIYIQQYGDPFDTQELVGEKIIKARQTLNELKKMFEYKSGHTKPLIYYSRNPSSPGAHAVTPYKLERIGNSSKFNIRIYDSNKPGDKNQIILIDSAANKWTDQTGLNFGSDSTGCFLGFESTLHLYNPILNKQLQLKNVPASNSEANISLKVYNTSNAEIKISSTTGGDIGYYDGVLNNTSDIGFPKIPITGYPHLPIGYYLPDGQYQVKLNKFSDPFSYIFFMKDSTIYNYRRYDAKTDENDMLSYSNGLGIENPDQALKSINLETIIEEDSGEKVFATDKLQITKDDSIHIKKLDRDKLELKNFGTAKSYNLLVRRADQTESQKFNHANISIANNSSHRIVPVWSKLEIEPVKILIDNGIDGSIDDSIFVSNELTGAIDLFKGKNPNEFHLYQNYPNPFNPTTKIKYSIPSVGTSLIKFVQLKVYDILGREVATLVNKKQQPGNYEVTFDASNLASGVYFYSLKTGSFIKTKKMQLLK